ncbi:MAG: hypothetical protein LBL66_04490 [Clostridiales bacterium]|jgi:hypothetical protein|nr:hypothetical protein [Clostridiales bacterium]
MDLQKALKGDLKDYTSLPFWSWNNELDPKELIRQIRAFKEQGIDGFIMHARTGLRTAYLSDAWFDCVRACLREARELGMRAWGYDENGWPSGFAGGSLLKPGNYAQYITYGVKDAFDPAASAVYAMAGGRAERLKPGGKAARYHCLYIHDHPCYADILNERVVSEFIGATHEEYYKRFPDSFGRELEGFFTDEPQYFRYAAAFSRVLPAAWEKAYGGDIYDGLIYLFTDGDDSKLFRYNYFSLLNTLYTEVFYKRLYDWCEGHNCMLTGHTVEETTLSGQLWCCAGAMPSYEYEHVPGIDWLGRLVGREAAASPRQAGSVAQQFGKKRVLTETYGCSGWDTTPRELRRIAEFQYVNGVNTMCQHLVSYSLKGQGKSDYPPSFSAHNVWINGSKPFNDYFKRLSYILCNTAECADTLFIHPIRSAYMTYRREEDYVSIRETEDSFLDLTKTLSAGLVQYHYGDERILRERGKADGGAITVGKCRYTRVVVPRMESMESATVKLLADFAAAGGKLCFTDAPPVRENAVLKDVGLRGNCALADIRPAFDLRVSGGDVSASRRSGEIGEFLYIVNSSETETAAAEYGGGYRIVDLRGAELREGVSPLEIPPMSSVMLKLEPGARARKAEARPETDITGQFALASAGDNALTLDFARFSKDGKAWSEPYYAQYLNELLIKEGYAGPLWVKYEFTVADAPERARIRFERNKNTSAQLNGADLKTEQSAWDAYFLECGVSGALKTGVNEFTVRMDYFQKPQVRPTLYGRDVLESLINCLAIDTEIESAYLIGPFAVNGAREIVKEGGARGTADLQEKGYPNFAGAAVLAGSVELEKELPRAALRLEGRYMTAAVRVNGEPAGELMLDGVLELPAPLKKGRSDIEIEITSSMRNQLGPHHCKRDPEPKGVNPGHFNFRNSWQGGASPDFTPAYNLVKFGLDRIVLIG